MLQIVNIVFPIFAIVLVGYLYARRHGPDMASANRLNVEIFTPALIFHVLTQEGFDLSAYGDLALAAAVVVLGSGVIAWPIGRLLGYPFKVFVPPMMFNNSGNMGLPLALFAFGEQALPAAMILFLVENTLHFSVGGAMLTGHFNPLRLLLNPMLASTLLGIAVALSGVSIPAPLAETVKLLGQIAIPLMLFALGVRLTSVDFTNWRIGVVGALVAPLSGLICAIPALTLISLDPPQAEQLLVFSILPPAVLNYMLAERYNLYPQQMAAIVLIGNLASLVTIPAALYWVL